MTVVSAGKAYMQTLEDFGLTAWPKRGESQETRDDYYYILGWFRGLYSTTIDQKTSQDSFNMGFRDVRGISED